MNPSIVAALTAAIPLLILMAIILHREGKSKDTDNAK